MSRKPNSSLLITLDSTLTRTLKAIPTTNPIIISGPSGVGKGTLYSRLLSNHPNLFTTSISHTTRAPRPGETPNVDYYYISMEEFERMIEKGDFVEHAKFGGNRYGTSRKMIEEKRGEGKVVVLDIEMEVCFPFSYLTSLLPAQFFALICSQTTD
jgi:guanylate kinase